MIRQNKDLEHSPQREGVKFYYLHVQCTYNTHCREEENRLILFSKLFILQFQLFVDFYLFMNIDLI